MGRIDLSHLTKRYGDNMVVDDVSLEIHDGEFLTLLGPSGCGKTTTLRMIAGFIKPDGGTIAVDGVVLSGPDGVVAPQGRRMWMLLKKN
jgi:ABC-type Fe3+/spermidine/putrescine transport system ATPase subunit